MTTYTEPVTVTRSQIENIDVLCHGIVIRDGIEDACCKPASAILHDAESATIWPACTWHANRYGGALTLAQIREALTAGAVQFERQVADW